MTFIIRLCNINWFCSSYSSIATAKSRSYIIMLAQAEMLFLSTIEILGKTEVGYLTLEVIIEDFVDINFSRGFCPMSAFNVCNKACTFAGM